MTVSNPDDPPLTASRRRRCAEASQTCSLAQCPASTRYGPAPRRLALLQRGVVAQVGGDVDVDVGRGPPEAVVARPAEDGHPLDQTLWIATHPDAADGRRQPARHLVGEGAQGHRRGEVPDPAERIRDVLEGDDVGEPDRRGERVADPGATRRRRWCGRSRWRGHRGSRE